MLLLCHQLLYIRFGQKNILNDRSNRSFDTVFFSYKCPNWDMHSTFLLQMAKTTVCLIFHSHFFAKNLLKQSAISCYKTLAWIFSDRKICFIWDFTKLKIALYTRLRNHLWRYSSAILSPYIEGRVIK